MIEHRTVGGAWVGHPSPPSPREPCALLFSLSGERYRVEPEGRDADDAVLSRRLQYSAHVGTLAHPHSSRCGRTAPSSRVLALGGARGFPARVAQPRSYVARRMYFVLSCYVCIAIRGGRGEGHLGPRRKIITPT